MLVAHCAPPVPLHHHYPSTPRTPPSIFLLGPARWWRRRRIIGYVTWLRRTKTSKKMRTKSKKYTCLVKWRRPGLNPGLLRTTGLWATEPLQDQGFRPKRLVATVNFKYINKAENHLHVDSGWSCKNCLGLNFDATYVIKFDEIVLLNLLCTAGAVFGQIVLRNNAEQLFNGIKDNGWVKSPKYSDVTREKEKQLGEKAGLAAPEGSCSTSTVGHYDTGKKQADRSRSLVISQRSSFLDKEEGV